ncbi:MAG: nickel-dependent hydrogenase large subunit [Coriobacteriia bacterium]|nr:nickel-dependent hydrogenase large subunit [Coriobacteriia bacterium]
MAYPANVNFEVDPISRIEGHLGIGVAAVAGGKITDAYAHGNLWRGFENFLLGRDVNDAITFVQRICGVCPVPHGMTSTYAVDTVLQYSKGHITFADDGAYGVPAAAVLIRNLVLGMEFLMSSITHFYHLAAPSYIQGPAIPPWTPYFADGYYHPLMKSGGKAYPEIVSGANPGTGFSKNLWSTVIRSYVVALRIRRLTFEAGALFAGRMPMTSVYCGGGVTYDKTELGTAAFQARCDTFASVAKEVGQFVVQEYVPIALALGALYPNFDNLANATTLQAVYPTLWGLAGNASATAPTSANTGYGAGVKRFLAWGAFPDALDTSATAALTVPGGVKFAAGDGFADFTVSNKAEVASKFIAAAATATCVPTNLREEITYSRYQVASGDVAAYGGASGTSAYPGAVSRTSPKRSKATAYTYMKAPRWNGLPCEVGPMARMFVSSKFVNGTPLRTSLGAAYTVYAKAIPGGSADMHNGLGLGLDPKMINADIAVALVQAGLASLSSASSGTVIVPAGGPLPSAASATIAAYAGSDTVITGVIADWVLLLTAGFSTIDLLRGRALESLVLVQAILGAYSTAGGSWNTTTGVFTGTWGGGWIKQLHDLPAGDTWKVKAIPAGVVQGWGATEAPRGALMHQCESTNGKITKYQCIVPTTWNGSPMGSGGHGPIEQAVIGAPFAALDSTFKSQDGSTTKHSVGGVEVLRVAQSFDPCIACAIH